MDQRAVGEQMNEVEVFAKLYRFNVEVHFRSDGLWVVEFKKVGPSHEEHYSVLDMGFDLDQVIKNAIQKADQEVKKRILKKQSLESE